MDELGISVFGSFVDILPFVIFEGRPCTVLTTVRKLQLCPSLYMSINIFCYRELACKSLVAMKVKCKEVVKLIEIVGLNNVH